MATTNKNQTKFENILKSMNLEDKAEVMRGLTKAWEVFKEHIEANGDKWIDVICNDEPLNNLFIMSSISSGLWFDEYRRKNN